VRRTTLVIAVIAILAALVAVVLLRSGKAPAEDASVETEVAVHIAKITRTTLRAYVMAYGVVEPAPPGEHPAAGTRSRHGDWWWGADRWGQAAAARPQHVVPPNGAPEAGPERGEVP
jgi:hypothetical protein